jgi:hypothetical protein
MSEVLKLQLLERAAIEAIAWHWTIIDFPFAAAEIRQQAAEAAKSLSQTLGVPTVYDSSVVEAGIKQLDADLTAHIEETVKTALEKAQEQAAAEQASHLKTTTKLQESALEGRKIFDDLKDEDPASYEAFVKIADHYDAELLNHVQELHLITLEFIFGKTMMDKDTAKELAKLYAVSLELGQKEAA